MHATLLSHSLEVFPALRRLCESLHQWLLKRDVLTMGLALTVA